MTRWNDETAPKRRRKSARALRFAEIKVGGQLMVSYASEYQTSDGAGGYKTCKNPRSVWYWVVTDLFFDPVAGEYDETAGRMVAIKRLCPHTGEPIQGKRSHSIRGLASNGYHYADVDFMALMAARLQGKATGDVVEIGRGHVIRRRPKVPGRLL